ncbi:MAG TPA: nuclear transport factor 2 family protein [Longimicrobium sp.]|uniref:nuclear transport factor 2 family protein n=1 Tax=Longimicrobium sp. TaxID=2029185 RepID=UPI002ED91CCA
MIVKFLGAAAMMAALATAGTAQAQNGAARGQARTAAADSAGAHAAATGFLAAFDSLQWERFSGYMADDVTMFFPFGDTPARVDGRAAVEARFRTFFEGARAAYARSGRPGEPRLGIVPQKLRIQMAGDVSIVSFELGTANPSRRSLVFQRRGDGWKLIHWHASPSPQPARPAQADSTARPGN